MTSKDRAPAFGWLVPAVAVGLLPPTLSGVLAALVLPERWGARRRATPGTVRRPPRNDVAARVGPA